jgi:Flp pilus assembly protein CpaB
MTDLRIALSRHRALLAAGLAAAAVAASLNVVAPTQERGVLVLVARHDLAAGTALVTGDVRRVEVPRGLVPSGVLAAPAEAVGRVLGSPMRAGEPLTDLRLAGSALLPSGLAGVVAVPVRIADAASAALVAAGDHVDVLAAASRAGGPPYAQVVASDAEVLAVPTAVADAGDGALVVVAATQSVAARLAAAAVSSRLSLTLRPRG